MVITAVVAAVAFAAPAASTPEPPARAVSQQEPYGGCKEAYDHPWTPGWRWCVRNERIFVAIRPCVGEIGRARCAWDARHEGNGQGQSVVLVRNGVKNVGHRFAHVVIENWESVNCG